MPLRLSPSGASLLARAMGALGANRLEHLPRFEILDELAQGEPSQSAPADALGDDPSLPDLLLTPVVGELLSSVRQHAGKPLYVDAKPARILAVAVVSLLVGRHAGCSAIIPNVGTGRTAYELARALGTRRIVASAPTEEFAAVAELGMALMAAHDAGRGPGGDDGECSLPTILADEDSGVAFERTIGIAACDSSLEREGDSRRLDAPLAACVHPRSADVAQATKALREDAIGSPTSPLSAVIELPNLRVRNRRYPFGISPTPLTIWVRGRVPGIHPATVRLIDLSSPAIGMHSSPAGLWQSPASDDDGIAGAVRGALLPSPHPSSAWGDVPIDRIRQRRDLSLRLSSYEDVLGSAETFASDVRTWDCAPDSEAYARAISDLEAAERLFEEALARSRKLLGG